MLNTRIKIIFFFIESTIYEYLKIMTFPCNNHVSEKKFIPTMKLYYTEISNTLFFIFTEKKSSCTTT